MKNNKLLLIFLLFLALAYLATKTSFITHAQQQNDEQIPSDLSLDLDLAEKNPAPSQKLLQEAQVEKAQIRTSNGEKVDIPVKENIPEEIKTQSSQAAENPEQTTSEQVQSSSALNTQENNNQNADTSNTIPGTSILEPDDNAAPPAPTTSANPATSSSDSSPASPTQRGEQNSSPADSSSTPNEGVSSNPETNNYTTPANPQTDNTQPANGTTIPLENGATTPPANPPPPSNPSSDNSGGSSDQSASNDSGSDDSSAVQGVSAGPTLSLWHQLRSKVSKLLGG